MRVFMTGATGFIGTALIPELLSAGHTVLGLTRSDEGAAALRAAGVDVHRGNLEDLDSIRSGAAQADGVIHLGFNHDFSKFAENCAMDRDVITALGETLAGTGKHLVITSGTAIANTVPGQLATEESPTVSSAMVPRAATEEAANAVAATGVPVSIVRLPQVHDPYKQGLVPYAIDVARKKGVSVYIGDGSNRWPSAHVSDVARLYRLAFEKQQSGARYHAVAEEGVSMSAIADVIGRGLKVPVVSIAPEEAGAHFGWLGHFVSRDLAASSAITRRELNWNPTGPTLLADLEQMKWV